MTSCQDSKEDTRPLLHPSIEIGSSRDFYYPSFQSAIVTGALVHLGKWPSHLFKAFITICLAFTTFIIVTLVILSSLSKDIETNDRLPRSTTTKEYPNIYFVGETNQTWSREDLCGIESSARDYPDLTIYLINLPNQRISHNLNGIAVPISQSFDSTLGTVAKLQKRYKNIQSIDMTDRTFFKNSILEKLLYNNFDENVFAIAVRSHLLWTHFGVALNPSIINQLINLKPYLYKQGEIIESSKKATISLDGLIQASPITCHAFYGHLLKIIVSKFRSPDFIKEAFESFCPRHIECSGVEIFNNTSKIISNELSCPIIFPGRNLKMDSQSQQL